MSFAMDSFPMLTTIDNPYDPFTQFDDWKAFDEFMGYYTCEYLARIVVTSPDLSPAEANLEVDRAINEICRINPLGIYRKAYPKGASREEPQEEEAEEN